MVLCFVCAPTNNRQLAKRWAKGTGERRVHIPRSSTLANRSPCHSCRCHNSNGINIRKFSHLGHLDFEIERGDDGANLCVFRLLYSGWKNHI